MTPTPTPVRSWDLDPNDIDATDYIIGSTLGAWTYDEESLTKAILVACSQVFIQAGMTTDDAAEAAFRSVFPPEGSDERTVNVSVVRDGDAYKVQFDFERSS